MVAGVCHEIANPLTAIHSTMQFLQSRQDFPAETLTRALNNINDNVKRALNIAHQLNDYTRAGGDEKTRVRLDLAIAESLKLVQQEYPCGGVAVHFHPSPEIYVLGNGERLEQMFTNIMANAMQVMNGRGELSITVVSSDRHVEITISDSGPGIASEHLACLFKPFFTTKTRGQGTGLGLAICNEIAIEHEGTIRAGNNPGGGAFFCVRLPLYTE
jgi:C4-dicarboxylate-specific signal transduction histidine kinase